MAKLPPARPAPAEKSTTAHQKFGKSAATEPITVATNDLLVSFVLFSFPSSTIVPSALLAGGCCSDCIQSNLLNSEGLVSHSQYRTGFDIFTFVSSALFSYNAASGLGMACCIRYCAAEAQFDRKVAERDLRRYRRRGPNAITRFMLTELRRRPLEGRQLLDVGGGIGILPIELRDTGIASVTLVEASPAYLEIAQREVGSCYGPGSAQFLLGDFAEMAATLPGADLVTLDRVVCCYLDAEALLRAAALRTRQLLAFSYPRNRWYVRTLIALENFWRRLKGSEFRTFVHSPQLMGALLEAAGLMRIARHETFVWIADVYCRNSS